MKFLISILILIFIFFIYSLCVVSGRCSKKEERLIEIEKDKK